jgi:hypothetical protein
VAVINGVLAFLGTIGPFLIMMQQQRNFHGNQPNVLGKGDQFKDIHITWKVAAVK